jgi:DivIVA domain-containing protein
MDSKQALQLDIDAILNKQFSVEFKGYSPVEVDQFLDTVVRDYDTYDQMVTDLKDQLTAAQHEASELKVKNAQLEEDLKKAQQASASEASQAVVGNLSQVDILRRIARLEQEVFNNKK